MKRFPFLCQPFGWIGVRPSPPSPRPSSVARQQPGARPSLGTGVSCGPGRRPPAARLLEGLRGPSVGLPVSGWASFGVCLQTELLPPWGGPAPSPAWRGPAERRRGLGRGLRCPRPGCCPALRGAGGNRTRPPLGLENTEEGEPPPPGDRDSRAEEGGCLALGSGGQGLPSVGPPQPFSHLPSFAASPGERGPQQWSPFSPGPLL